MRRRGRRLAAGLLGGALLAGCGSQGPRYSYVRVQVAIDPVSVSEETLREINACGLSVSGAAAGSFALPCTRGEVAYDVGTFEYSTTRGSGELRFTAVMQDLERRPIATGSSPPVAIVAGATAATEVLASAPGSAADGGAGAGGEDAGERG